MINDVRESLTSEDMMKEDREVEEVGEIRELSGNVS